MSDYTVPDLHGNANIKWSHYNYAIFDTFQSTQDNIIVQAAPGSGKTTTLNHLCSFLTRQDDAIYLAFNKAIVEEAKAKLPSHVDVMTLNGLGHRAVTAEYGRIPVDGLKVYKIINRLIKRPYGINSLEWDTMKESINKAVGLMKIHLDVTSPTAFSDMCAEYDIDEFPGLDVYAVQILEESDSITNVIDYNDQLRFPIIYDLPLRCYDNILCDEVQDFNPIQVALITKLQGRYVFVGDTRQSIYGFRGALNDSMLLLTGRFNCTQLPLSISYRCPKSVVKVAQGIYLSDIEAWSEAPEGIVREGAIATEQYTIYDLVLCRNNGPLVEYAYQLLKRGIACHVKGRDIGQGLVRLIKKLSPEYDTTIISLEKRLYEWADIEVDKAITALNFKKAVSLQDKAESLKVIISQCTPHDTVQSAIDKVNALFTDKHNLTLSTVHKAKGLEAVNVYLLRPDLMPSPYAREGWQRIQERNIEYVAVTRSKEQLVYL